MEIKKIKKDRSISWRSVDYYLNNWYQIFDTKLQLYRFDIIVNNEIVSYEYSESDAYCAANDIAKDVEINGEDYDRIEIVIEDLAGNQSETLIVFENYEYKQE